MKYKTLNIILSFLILLPLYACSSEVSPTEADVEEYLLSRIQSDVTISDINMKIFAGNPTGSGRVSVTGTVELREDRYDNDDTYLANALAALGFSRQDISFYASDMGLPYRGMRQEIAPSPLFSSIAETGADTDISAEIGYMATVDGFEFSGRILGWSDVGAPFSELPDKRIMVDSEEMLSLLARYKSLRREWQRRQAAAMAKFEGFLIGKPLYASSIVDVYADPLTYVQNFVLEVPSDMNWSVSQPDELEFWVRGDSEWLHDGRWANSSFHSGAQVPMQLHGTVQILEDGIIDVRMNISVPNSSGTEFYHTGTVLQLYIKDEKLYMAAENFSGQVSVLLEHRI